MGEAITKPRVRRGRQSGAPTISDVAALAGVSTMTVSRVINKEGSVRETTRDTVLAAIERLNYAPNRAARSLAGAAQLRMALLYSNPSAAYLSEFLVGSLDQAGRGDIQLVVEKCEGDGDERRVAQRLIDSGIDGIILPPPLCDSRAILDYLTQVGVPMVVVATGKPADGATAVSIDDRAAAQAMTRHLIALGHTRIGFIVGNPNQTASEQRLAGFRAALADAGIADDPALVVDGLFTYRSGLDAAEALLDLDPPPTAIFASNDDMAAASVAVAHRRGFDVPGDLTVCGFDDSALATTVWPELTTIHQPIADMSRRAVDLLAERIRARRSDAREPIQRVVLDYTLIRRQSDASPRRRPRAALRVER
ncbi:LacI family DNA-binding transcriptional regulator [Sphingomonas sp. ac-8]|uniref:LacI family DNA-binding transcriptional regulator n=1 Tax=Sphingomonas sp. ac-8 TaxID=3242977 RepID=UPI003A805F38